MIWIMNPKLVLLVRKLVVNGLMLGYAVWQLRWLAKTGDALVSHLPAGDDMGATLRGNRMERGLLESEPIFAMKSAGAPSCHAVHADEVSYTLVTQTSMDRLWMMEHQCQRWGDHPISIAVGTKVSHHIVRKALERLGCHSHQLTVQTYGDFDAPGSYPVNALRNMALSGVRTTHALVLDMDFLLQDGTFEILQHFRSELSNSPQTSLVIPAFEFRSLCDAGHDCRTLHQTLIPKTKSELLEFYLPPNDDPAVAPFDSKKNIAGHGSTRYNDWIVQDDTTLIPIECVTSPRYEPYLIVRYCEDLPPFQEAYRGYGQNKMTWMQHLVRAGYRFYQTPTFAIHFPHKPSVARKQWDRQRTTLLAESSRVQSEDPSIAYANLQVNQISAKFQAWMVDHVPDRTVVAQCGASLC